MKMINKKILWVLLGIFIAFDNIYSYIAIVDRGMREWNPIAAYFVSINPLWYFLSIPLTLVFLHFVIRFVGWVTAKTEKNKKQEVREFTEHLMLSCLVIAWGIGVTSFNFATFVNGFSNPRIRYEIVLAAGALSAASYAIYMGLKVQKKLW